MLQGVNTGKDLMIRTPAAQEIVPEVRRLLHSGGSNHQRRSEETAHRMGEIHTNRTSDKIH